MDEEEDSKTRQEEIWDPHLHLGKFRTSVVCDDNGPHCEGNNMSNPVGEESIILPILNTRKLRLQEGHKLPQIPS